MDARNNHDNRSGAGLVLALVTLVLFVVWLIDVVSPPEVVERMVLI